MSSSTRSANVGLKPLEVSKALQEGEKFVKWDEDSGIGLPVTLRVDPKGFFLFWTDQNLEVEMLDIATIRDVRTGLHAKVPKNQKIYSSRQDFKTSYQLANAETLINRIPSLSQLPIKIYRQITQIELAPNFDNVEIENILEKRAELLSSETTEKCEMALNLN